MKNQDFERAFSALRLSGEAEERILRAALEEPRPRRRAGYRRSPVWTAIAAALILAVLSGTALAVSPELRELLWGDFGPVVQSFEPTEENTGVYDGVEAGITSAVTDGFITRVHVDFRDTQGDRLRALTDSNAFLNFSGHISLSGPGGSKGSRYDFGLMLGSAPRILGFDGETGKLTVEYELISTNPPESGDTLGLSIPTGMAGTRAVIHREPAPDLNGGDPIPDAMIVTDTGWNLLTPVEALSTRHGESGGVQADISELGVTLYGQEGTYGLVQGSQVRIFLTGGAEPTAEEGWLLDDQQFGVLNNRPVRVLEFSAPMDVSQVDRILVGELEIVFE